MKTQINNLKKHLAEVIIILMVIMLNIAPANAQTVKDSQFPDNSGNRITDNNLKYVQVKIRAIPEGLYNPATGQLEKSPQVLVLLKNILPPFETVGNVKGMLDKNTFSGTFTFPNTETGTYYIVLLFNNSAETWSRNGGEYLQKGRVTDYDFTTGKDKAYGENMKFINEYACIYTGDTDRDGFISRNDLNFVMRDLGKTGDLVSDMNGDEFVDAGDLSIVMNNYENNVKSATPTVYVKTVFEIKIMIEGLCDYSSKGMKLSPNVTVTLRNANFPYQVADEATGIIFDNTLEGDFFFTKVETGNYFIVVKYKNTIETWSKSDGIKIIKGGVVKYDFTTGKDKAYGDNMFFDGEFACIYTGDIDQNGFINQNDIDLVMNDLGNTGDLITDLNGDQYVDASDLSLVMNNSDKHVMAVTPLKNSPQLTQNGNSTSDFTLNQNKPNPFNPSTKVSFNISSVSKVKLSVYDMTGREVEKIVNSVLSAGNYDYEWNAGNLSSGTYFCRLNVNGKEQIIRMMLIK